MCYLKAQSCERLHKIIKTECRKRRTLGFSSIILHIGFMGSRKIDMEGKSS